ncbi:hypothetical protein MPSYJ_44060 [Mycolicibacterium psychrotolerans]|uniref:Uncharacterized protein n=1 Tax=Mycolicibacterium psychrotolerans TaxID=216929 RepID=A0A7I7MFK4_9MYCO|nr:hypothetical protein MPSYJ_44060 [Mycolicibacterium psychrotolerans]
MAAGLAAALVGAADVADEVASATVDVLVDSVELEEVSLEQAATPNIATAARPAAAIDFR